MSSPSPDPRDVTRLLGELAAGDRAALDRLFSILYEELRELARRQLGGRPQPTLSTTVLVHELYLKFFRASAVAAVDRQHFFSLSARAMRQLLVDHARRRSADRRPNLAHAKTLDNLEIPVEAPLEELLALEAVLGKLEALDPALARLVEWRVFAGLTLEEISGMIDRSLASLKRDWRKARAFLARELGAGD